MAIMHSMPEVSRETFGEPITVINETRCPMIGRVENTKANATTVLILLDCLNIRAARNKLTLCNAVLTAKRPRLPSATQLGFTMGTIGYGTTTVGNGTRITSKESAVPVKSYKELLRQHQAI